MKKNLLCFVPTAFLALAIVAGCEKKSKLVTGPEKAPIQEAMQAYIDAKVKSNNGSYPVDQVGGTFVKLHEKVKIKGEHFVSCADVADPAQPGVKLDIDYLVVKTGGTYEVVKELYHKKKIDGTKEMVNKILWQK